MAQKDKVKELVGRGLDSYHTKSLQQIDRIEKKNKEQNHKISILTNELDNDYLTKTEEGSVISLEHSKEGMVYLDELQGNTLVNYCTDGSKEMTLNGDIDVEGTFVTTTEGVDNGLVDVMCEGNTLVNIFSTNNYSHTTHAEIRNNITHNITKNSIEVTFNKDCIGSEYMVLLIGDVNTKHISMLKPNQKYTLCFDVEQNYDWTLDINCKKGNSADPLFIANRVKIKNGRNKITMTTLATLPTLTDQRMYLDIADKIQRLAGRYLKISNLVLVENEEDDIVPYFEGMKSVGQDDENGHKIEILSRNKNLIDALVTGSVNQSGLNSFMQGDILNINGQATGQVDINYTPVEWVLPLQKGKKYRLSFEVLSDKNSYNDTCRTAYKVIRRDGIAKWLGGFIQHPITSYIINGDEVESIGRIRMHGSNNTAIYTNFKVRCQLEISDQPTSYQPYNSNKKEILVNEPLRSLPNGIKDRMVKIGGKYFIERNLYGITLNGNSNENWEIGFTNFGTPIFSWNKTGINTYKSEPYYSVLSDRFIYARRYSQTETNYKCIYVYNYGDANEQSIRIQYPLNSVEEFRNYLSANPIDVIIRLETPTYEPLEIEPTLNTYNDITHISNNSIIPCKMKIKNTGYNAIIKPSTQYTVALDTNKSGTIGVNLGGAKVTTTNNVATITTPATLTDDSLRLYGKDIKGSKVRLLEGDKTNWIPSHFEGMKSSFEDKFDATDNTYKMEILSNNKNLLGEENIVAHVNITSNNGVMTTINFTNDYGWFRLKLKNTYKLKAGTYYFQFKMRSDGYKGIINDIRFEDITDIKYLRYSERLTNPNCNSDYQIYEFKFVARNDLDINYFFIQGNTTSSKNLQLKDFMLSRIETVSYESNKSNKIQFSSIEPLRGVGNVKDKFVFKDNRLMIERNCKDTIFDGIKNVCSYMTSQSGKTTKYGQITFKNGGKIVADSLSYRSSWGSDVEGIETNGIAIGIRLKNAKLDLTKSNPMNEYLKQNPIKITYLLEEPTYEEIPFELQKIILEGYENGTLFFDTNIPPTSTITYAGETPIVESVKLNKTEVLNNTNDINDNIIPYLMDMDYRLVCLQLETNVEGISMAKLFGGTYEMLKRDIQSNRLSKEEYGYRLIDYFNAGKLTEQEVRELEDLI